MDDTGEGESDGEGSEEGGGDVKEILINFCEATLFNLFFTVITRGMVV